MTNAVTVKNITFQEGETLICVPLIGKTLDEILGNAHGLVDAGADIIEWRVDHFAQVREMAQVMAALAEIRGALKALPLLFTFRSKKEGGETELSDEAYFALNREAARSGLVDVIDIELFNDEAQIRALVDDAHAAGVKVIMSNHDFHKTPAQEDIIYRLRRMQDLGADLPKIAVMPEKKADLLTLLLATVKAKEEISGPIITMSMAGTGLISRISGEAFGSALTFGTAGKASAPGQMDAKELRQVLTLLHENMA